MMLALLAETAIIRPFVITATRTILVVAVVIPVIGLIETVETPGLLLPLPALRSVGTPAAGSLSLAATLIAPLALLRQRLGLLLQRGKLPAVDLLRALAHQLQHLRGLGRHGNGLDLDTGLTQHEPGFAALLRQHKRNHVALVAGTRGTAGTMQERLRILRRLDLHHKLHATDVDAACSHVSGGKHVHLAGFKGREIAVALVLVEVAVQLGARDALLGQALGKLLRLELGAGEQDALACAGSQGAYDLGLIALGDLEHVMRHLIDRAGRVVNAVHLRIMQEAFHYLVDAMIERRGEQHMLRIGRNLAKQTLHAGQEAHVGHLIGLIEYHTFDAAQRKRVLTQQILQTARAADHDLRTGLELGDLTGILHTAIHGGGSHAIRLRKRQQHLVDLLGELTGGGKHQSARTRQIGRSLAPCTAAAIGLTLDGGDIMLADTQTCHQRNGESKRFAGTRASTAKNVATRKRVGKSVRLDGESGTLAVAGEYMRQSARHAKLGESRCGIVHDALLGIFGRIIDIGHSGLSFRYCAVCANYPTVPHGVHFRHADVCRTNNPVNAAGCERRPVLATPITFLARRHSVGIRIWLRSSPVSVGIPVLHPFSTTLIGTYRSNIKMTSVFGRAYRLPT